MSLIPSLPPPNYVNPQTRGVEMWVVTSIFLSLATTCVGTRLYTRIVIRRWFGLDDILIVLAYLSTLVVTIGVMLGHAKYDWGKHLWDMHIETVGKTLKIVYIIKIFWGVASSLIRLSILCLFYRLIKVFQAPPIYRYILHFLTAFTISFLIAYVIAGIAVCSPISSFWAWPPDPNRHCIRENLSIQTSAVINTASELVLAVLPIIAAFRLPIDRRQRWSVIAVLSLGFLVVIAGCTRIYYVWKLSHTIDFTWYASPHWVCSEAEIYTALICACGAPLRPVIGRTFKRLGFHHLPAAAQKGKSMRSSSDPRGQSFASTDGCDITIDDYAAWNGAMESVYTCVDLEGIRVDNLGYTVRITGPPPKPKKRRRLWGDGRKSELDSHDSKDPIKEVRSKENNKSGRLEIVKNQTYDVT